jgi:S-methylmethionine-dependent homocysteine/selenocysteine methylase/SAM-dependent methyltransferase
MCAGGTRGSIEDMSGEATMIPTTAPAVEPAYHAVRRALAEQRCVILDGAVATELPDDALAAGAHGEHLWGIRALAHSPGDVLEVHRRYVDIGCDVITTNTWGLAAAVSGAGPTPWDDGAEPIHWLEIARRGVRVARQAISAGGRDGRAAVAFSLNGDVDGEEGRETIRLLERAFADAPPDLLLVETLSLVSPSLRATVERLLATGLPVWLSFRRCRHGLCGVYGQHWGGPEGDAFGRAARRFEEMGVGALLVNCIPPDHVDGMVSFLRDFTDLPLGVYPNLGYYTNAGWRFQEGVGGAEYAEMALRWREEGAQLPGGCRARPPPHTAAAAARLAGTGPGRRRPGQPDLEGPAAGAHHRRHAAPWRDRAGRTLFPLPFPDLVVDGSTFVPTQGSFLVWRHLFQNGVGAGRRCLDVGCGTGLQTVQLALNGAAHVHGIDVDADAVGDTLTNAFRNGVADRVTAAAVDLYPWVPEERYETVVASLYQTPVDPFRQVSGHRPVDYWGRNAVDHLIGMLPQALTADGEAYLMLLSILSQERTADLLEQNGLEGEVVDFAFFPFSDHFRESREQIERVEGLSDAYHLRVGASEAMVAYLLRVTRR